MIKIIDGCIFLDKELNFRFIVCNIIRTYIINYNIIIMRVDLVVCFNSSTCKR